MTQKKKVVYFITKSNFGGAQRYVYTLATSLPQKEYDVLVVLGGEGTLKEKLISRGIKTVTLKKLERDVHFINEWLAFFSLVQTILKEKPDILHVNSSKAGGLGALAGRICGVRKVIFTAHGWAFNEHRPLWQKVILQYLHWLTILLSHKTIAVSYATKKQIAFLPFIAQKIVVIPNGITKPLFETRDSARTFLSSKETALASMQEKPWIGSIAELHATKGLSYALEAMTFLIQKTPGLTYIIIGEGEERENLERIIREKNLSKNIFLLGFIDEAARYLPAFDMFLFPSLSEASPYAPLEAGYAELPVVATKVGGIPEIITNRKNGLLIQPHNSQAIAEALKELISDEQLRKRYGEALYENVDKNFSLDSSVKKTIELYR